MLVCKCWSTKGPHRATCFTCVSIKRSSSPQLSKALNYINLCGWFSVWIATLSNVSLFQVLQCMFTTKHNHSWKWTIIGRELKWFIKGGMSSLHIFLKRTKSRPESMHCTHYTTDMTCNNFYKACDAKESRLYIIAFYYQTIDSLFRALLHWQTHGVRLSF